MTCSHIVYVVVICIGMASFCVFFFFFKQKTAYEIGTGDWSSDVCSSDLIQFMLDTQQHFCFFYAHLYLRHI